MIRLDMFIHPINHFHTIATNLLAADGDFYLEI